MHQPQKEGKKVEEEKPGEGSVGSGKEWGGGGGGNREVEVEGRQGETEICIIQKYFSASNLSS